MVIESISFVIPGRAKREPGIHNHDRRLWIPGLRQAAHPGMTVFELSGEPYLNPKQFRIARLDVFGRGFDTGWVFLHQLEVRNLPPPGLRLHLRMRRIVGEELLSFAGMQPRLEQPLAERVLIWFRAGAYSIYRLPTKFLKIVHGELLVNSYPI
jgi:hypothetical protein